MTKLRKFKNMFSRLFPLHIKSFKHSSTMSLKRLKHKLKGTEKVEKENLRVQRTITETNLVVTEQDSTVSAKCFNMRNQMVEELKAASRNPYPHIFHASISLQDFVDRFNGLDNGQILEDVSLSVIGRVVAKRVSGTKLFFYDIETEKESIQVTADAFYYPSKSEFYEINKVIRRGDIISCTGHPCKMSKGNLSIIPTNMLLLVPCLQMLPHPYYGLKDKETRLRKRHIDFIINHSPHDQMILRAKVNKYIRSFLEQRGFIEVETSMLNRAPGGATAKPFVTHHNELNMDFYLRIAPELKLKEILIGKADRIYEIGKQFRNEGIDAIHSPEFTTCELYEAYKDYNYLMEMIENLLSEMINSIFNSNKIKYACDSFEGKHIEIDFTPPFKKMPLLPALEEAMKEELPKPSEYYLPKANERLSYLCTKYNVECPAPRTTKRLLDKLVGQFLEKNIINPTFLYDHPRIMSPLAKQHRNISGLSERFELFIRKIEVVNAYTEENDPAILRKNFKFQAQDRFAGDGEAHCIDEQFCEAVEYGLKPCAGAGIGIDRLLMILSNKKDIKEVLSFPIVKPETNIKKNE